MNYLEPNLLYLKSLYPLLHNELASINIETGRYPIERTKEGSPTILINGNYVHSRFDPVREADRFIEKEISRETGFVIFAGFGLAYHIESFLNKFKDIDILVVEPDIDFFIHALSARDLKQVLHSERVKYLIGSAPDDCGFILEQYPGRIIQLLILRSVYNKDEDFYKSLDTFVRNYVSRKEINLSTLKRFGKLWVRNLAMNAPQLSCSPGITKIKDVFSDFPTLLIAAGPSLDKIKPHLQELKERFLIVAVDTALRACLEVNVEPDFTVVVDPQYWNSRHLDRCRTEKTILLSETSTYPSVFRQINGKVFLCSTAFPLGLYMEEKTEIKGKLKAGGSVATAAWDFCRTLSIKDIWCTGLDLGFPDKQTHCRGSFFEQRAHWLSHRNNPSETFSWHALNDAGLESIESNSGNKTWTDKRMSLYSRWFEEQMIKYQTVNSWNLSVEGIKIKGMPQKEVGEALKLPKIRNQINLNIEKIKAISTTEKLEGHLFEAFSGLIAELKSLKNRAEQGIRLTDLLENAFDLNEDLQPHLDALSALDEKILNSVSKDIAGFILQNFISSLLIENVEKKKKTIISNSRNLYKELSDSIEFHVKILTRSQKNIKKT